MSRYLIKYSCHFSISAPTSARQSYPSCERRPIHANHSPAQSYRPSHLFRPLHMVRLSQAASKSSNHALHKQTCSPISAFIPVNIPKVSAQEVVWRHKDIKKQPATGADCFRMLFVTAAAYPACTGSSAAGSRQRRPAESKAIGCRGSSPHP